MLARVYPDFSWDPLRFSRAPHKHWSSLDNQRNFLLNFGEKFGIKEGEVDPWYKVTYQDFIANNGGPIMRKYNNSFPKLLEAAFPELKFDPLKFVKAPQNYWASIENQRAFLEALGKKLGIEKSEKEKWYHLTTRKIISNGGRSLLKRHGDSVSRMLASVFPEMDWDTSKFFKAPDDMWVSLEKQRNFMDELGVKLGMDRGSYEGWYKVSHRDVNDLGGGSLLALYKDSLPSLLMNVYPEHKWVSWKFPRRPAKLASATIQQMLSEMEKAFAISDPKEWHRVTREQINGFGGAAKTLFSTKKKLFTYLKLKYPHETWSLSDDEV